MSGRPGANSRGRGGKFKKFTRGGGKHFSRDLKPLDAEGNEISMWSEDAQKQFQNSSDEDEEDEDSSDEEDEAGPSANGAEVSREDRKNLKKQRKEAAIAKAKAGQVQVGDLPPSSDEDDEDGDMPANPNHSKAARKQAVASPAAVDEAAEGVKNLKVAGAGAATGTGTGTGTPSRRERESLEAQQAKERYRKLHEAGKTEEAQSDLARLRLVREKREADAARREAEKAEREEQEKIKSAEIEKREAKKREAAMGKPAKGGKKAK